ncbi:hypothetical protein BH09PSE5_BH09PSE5_33030 [soil metagenome]
MLRESSHPTARSLDRRRPRAARCRCAPRSTRPTPRWTRCRLHSRRATRRCAAHAADRRSRRRPRRPACDHPACSTQGHVHRVGGRRFGLLVVEGADGDPQRQHHAASRELSDDCGQLVLVRQRFDEREVGSERCKPQGFDGCAIDVVAIERLQFDAAFVRLQCGDQRLLIAFFDTGGDVYRFGAACRGWRRRDPVGVDVSIKSVQAASLRSFGADVSVVSLPPPHALSMISASAAARTRMAGRPARVEV